MTSINRSKTWITPEFAAELAPKGRSTFFSELQKDTWENNKDEYLKYRKQVESTMNKFFDMQFKESDLQKTVFENFSKTMKERLGHNKELISKLGMYSNLNPCNRVKSLTQYALVPEFEVGCRRITPVSFNVDSGGHIYSY